MVLIYFQDPDIQDAIPMDPETPSYEKKYIEKKKKVTKGIKDKKMIKEITKKGM